MQELLGRIARLDPSASLGLRVIACFDELIVGNVNTKALLSAAAALAACPAGFELDEPARWLRVDPRGRPLTGERPSAVHALTAADGLTVWLERDGASGVNDALILERLALGLRVRHGRDEQGAARRDLELLVGDDADPEQRSSAAARLGLHPGPRYRVAVAPLFAVWEHHPSGPEDVVPTRFGPLHVLIVRDGREIAAAPLGLGAAVGPEAVRHSFRTAVVALRLCDPPRSPMVSADELGGLAGLLADATPDAPQPDADALAVVLEHPWAATTIEAVLRATSVRQAARSAGVHHSTLQQRLEQLTQDLGFDPFDGYGRTRLTTAYLLCRLRTSRVLELPAAARAQGGAGG